MNLTACEKPVRPRGAAAAWLVGAGAVVLVANAAETGPVETFTIGLEEVVADGVPDVGAGNIETPGSIDVYELQLVGGRQVFVDELAGSCSIGWRLEAPDGEVVFDDTGFCIADPGLLTLDQTGTYVFTAFGDRDATGTYSFIVWEVNPVETFTISLEDVVSEGVPAAGAGNIEEPGAIDVYELAIGGPTEVYAEEIAGGCAIEWTFAAPDGSTIFVDGAMCVGDPGVFTLEQTGVHTLTVFGEGDATGTYSFTLWNVNPPDEFAIGLEEIVEDGVPGAGAGNIEEPGAVDVYTLDVNAATDVFIDELGGGCDLRWSCEAPDGSPVFAGSAMCVHDPGVLTFDQTGAYTFTVFGEGAATGTYSFVIWELDEPQDFTIDLEELVENGAPGAGAGNIEEPGAVDVYALQAAADTLVFFDEVSGGCEIGWRCEAPGGATVFTDGTMCITDPGSVRLEESGAYTITVRGDGDATGTYSFIVWEVDPPDLFVIGLDEVVEDGAPGAGAGNIEEPGAVDVFTLVVDPDTSGCFEELAGGCDLAWQCEDSDGTVIFADHAMCLTDPGKFELTRGGAYTITVDGEGDATGRYSFIVNTGRPTDLSGDCEVEFEDILIVLVAWGTPDGDVDGDGETGFSDVLAILADWG